jgi:hypothetical protein
MRNVDYFEDQELEVMDFTPMTFEEACCRISRSRARKRRITLEPLSIWWTNCGEESGKRWLNANNLWTFSTKSLEWMKLQLIHS